MHQSAKLLLLTIAVVILGGLTWHLSRELKRELVAVQPSEEIKLTNSQASKEEKYPQHIEVIAGTDEVWYNIPEMGVRMRLNEEFAEDLIYSFGMTDDFSGEQSKSIYFSTKGIIKVAPECTPERGGALGFIFKADGDVREDAKTDEYLAARIEDYIQIDNYYYGWVGPQAVPWFPEHEEAVRKVWSPQNYRGSGAKYISDGIKNLQLISSK